MTGKYIRCVPGVKLGQANLTPHKNIHVSHL